MTLLQAVEMGEGLSIPSRASPLWV